MKIDKKRKGKPKELPPATAQRYAALTKYMDNLYPKPAGLKEFLKAVAKDSREMVAYHRKREAGDDG